MTRLVLGVLAITDMNGGELAGQGLSVVTNPAQWNGRNRLQLADVRHEHRANAGSRANGRRR